MAFLQKDFFDLVDYNSSTISKYLPSPSHPTPLIKDVVEGLSKFKLFRDIDEMMLCQWAFIDKPSTISSINGTDGFSSSRTIRFNSPY